MFKDVYNFITEIKN